MSDRIAADKEADDGQGTNEEEGRVYEEFDPFEALGRFFVCRGATSVPTW